MKLKFGLIMYAQTKESESILRQVGRCNAIHEFRPLARTKEATFMLDLRLAHVIRRPKRLLHAHGTRARSHAQRRPYCSFLNSFPTWK
jgi:hypothetical protein